MRPLFPSGSTRLNFRIFFRDRRNIPFFVTIKYDVLSWLRSRNLAIFAVFRLERSIDNQQIDLARIHIHPADLHNHPIGQLIADASPFPAQFMTDFIEMVIVVTQIGHMYQSFDKEIIKLDKNAETGHA